MRTVTATEASRSFAALLDDVQNGETVVIMRGGQRVALIGPAPTATGARLRELLADPVDDRYRADVDSIRAIAETQDDSWSDD